MLNELVTAEELSRMIVDDCSKTDKKFNLKPGTSAKLANMRIAASNGFHVTREEMLGTWMEGFVYGLENSEEEEWKQ